MQQVECFQEVEALTKQINSTPERYFLWVIASARYPGEAIASQSLVPREKLPALFLSDPCFRVIAEEVYSSQFLLMIQTEDWKEGNKINNDLIAFADLTDTSRVLLEALERILIEKLYSKEVLNVFRSISSKWKLEPLISTLDIEKYCTLQLSEFLRDGHIREYIDFLNSPFGKYIDVNDPQYVYAAYDGLTKTFQELFIELEKITSSNSYKYRTYHAFSVRNRAALMAPLTDLSPITIWNNLRGNLFEALSSMSSNMLDFFLETIEIFKPVDQRLNLEEKVLLERRLSKKIQRDSSSLVRNLDIPERVEESIEELTKVYDSAKRFMLLSESEISKAFAVYFVVEAGRTAGGINTLVNLLHKIQGCRTFEHARFISITEEVLDIVESSFALSFRELNTFKQECTSLKISSTGQSTVIKKDNRYIVAPEEKDRDECNLPYHILIDHLRELSISHSEGLKVALNEVVLLPSQSTPIGRMIFKLMRSNRDLLVCISPQKSERISDLWDATASSYESVIVLTPKCLGCSPGLSDIGEVLLAHELIHHKNSRNLRSGLPGESTYFFTGYYDGTLNKAPDFIKGYPSFRMDEITAYTDSFLRLKRLSSNSEDIYSKYVNNTFRSVLYFAKISFALLELTQDLENESIFEVEVFFNGNIKSQYRPYADIKMKKGHARYNDTLLESPDSSLTFGLTFVRLVAPELSLGLPRGANLQLLREQCQLELNIARGHLKRLNVL
jgi:hypothetical protein